MSRQHPPVATTDHPAEGSRRAYVVGFGLSLITTLMAYVATVQNWGHGFALLLLIAGLGLTQLFVQLVCFLHLGRESRPRWNSMVFGLTAIIVVILVAGSIWIMYNLNYHHGGQPVNETEQFILHDEGVRD